MSQHGRRDDAAEYEDEPERRFAGFLTMETALVLALVAAIVLGSLLVHVALPSKRQSQTVVGNQKVRITTVGKGGVLPGPVQPRTGPVPVATPEPEVVAPKPVKPRKTAVPVAAVATPTPTPSAGGGALPGGGTTTGGGGGGDHCTVVLLCKPGQKPSATPAATTSPTAPTATSPTGATGTQPAGQGPGSP